MPPIILGEEPQDRLVGRRMFSFVGPALTSRQCALRNHDRGSIAICLRDSNSNIYIRKEEQSRATAAGMMLEVSFIQVAIITFHAESEETRLTIN